MRQTTSTEVLVVGAGPAGLATSRELHVRGVDHLVLERGPRPGHTWENLYESLRLHTGKHLSALPGMKLGREVPLFPSRGDYVRYLHDYALCFEIPVLPGCEVTRLQRCEQHWLAHTCQGTLTARAVVMATGIVANPRIPCLPGREQYAGAVLHSVHYRRPAPFAGKRVLVVGVGNSGAEIGAELAAAGAEVVMAVRSGAHVVPRSLFGLPFQYASLLLRRLPRPVQSQLLNAMRQVTGVHRRGGELPRPDRPPLDAIPVIGFELVDAIRAGRVRLRGDVECLTADGARFRSGEEEPFDVVLLATGYEPALGILGGLVQPDALGFARRSDRVTSADQPGLLFVGHNYDALGGLYNIARDAVLAANLIVLRELA